jgi:hypothetical protein
MRRTGQAAKTVVGAKARTKLKVSEFGAHYDEQLFHVVDCWATLFEANPEFANEDAIYIEKFGTHDWLLGKCSPDVENPMNAGVQARFLIVKLRQAIETREGMFFRQLAGAIERYKNAPVDELRHWLANRFRLELYNLDGGQPAKGWEGVEIELETPTAAELVLEAERDGHRFDERQVRRACKELGIKLAPARKGRPPKKG